MPAPPKPWERNGSGGSSLPAGHPPTTGGGTCPVGGGTAATTTTGATAVGSSNPALPPRPSTMTTTGVAGTGLAGSTGLAAGTSGLGTAYGSAGYGGSYGSRYGGGYGGMSRFGGGYGSMMGGMGYGGYGGGYGMGGYGMGGYGGYGGYGMGGYGGMPGQVGPDGFSLTQRMEAGTQATFQILESVVGAFGGFAQMLESTFMATHSSFFAMVGVAEQFGHLRNYLGQVLSIFALLRWLKGLLFRVTGRDLPPELAHPWGAPNLDAAAFRAFEANGAAGPSGGAAPNAARPSRRPIIVFFLTVIGLPYLMNRLVRMISARQEEEARRRAEAGLPPLGPHGEPLGPDGMPMIGPDGQPLQHLPPSETAIDPSTLTFVRATHPFTSTEPQELTFQTNDIIAVLTPQAERQEPGWWRGRLRDGRIGWFPSTHVSEVPMKKAAKMIDGATPPNKDVPPKGGKGGGGGAGTGAGPTQKVA